MILYIFLSLKITNKQYEMSNDVLSEQNLLASGLQSQLSGH